MTLYRGPGGTGSATSDADTTLYQDFLNQTIAARDAALQAETNAELAETNAETAETNAETAATAAASSASAAASSASSASTSATNAASSASSASTSASNAASSASSASSSASAASTSATSAASSATAAASSASAASTSATNAANSATSASNSASTATTQATNAASSATAAASSATAAQSARTAAEAARDAALSAYDNFDDRYLGPKASDPTLDNDGNALVTGALYFNTASNVMRVYTGSAWVAAYVSAAGVLLVANNLSDVASTATARANLNVPTRTGGDASGTWGINISGNAATATSATSATTATTATNVSGGTASVTSVSNSGNLSFTGTGQRITGDFSNSTLANRVMFQTTTANSNTSVSSLPNGTATGSAFNAHNNSDPTNSGVFQLLALSTEMRLTANAVGTGTYLPMTFYTGGSERMRLDTSGNLGIGTSSPAYPLSVSRTTVGSTVWANVNNTDTTSGSAAGYFASNGSVNAVMYSTAHGGVGVYGMTTNHPAAFITNNAERMRITNAGNVGIGTSSPTNALQIVGTAKASSQIYVGSNSDDNYSGGILNLSNISRSISIQSDPTNSGANSILTFGVDGTERVRIDGSGQMSTTTGTGSVMVAYDARAWVNFNGTGTVAIRASGNVTSITDNNTGDYTINFTTAMPDANYAVAGSTVGSGSGATFVDSRGQAPTTTTCRFGTWSAAAGSTVDRDYVDVVIFR